MEISKQNVEMYGFRIEIKGIAVRTLFKTTERITVLKDPLRGPKGPGT